MMGDMATSPPPVGLSLNCSLIIEQADDATLGILPRRRLTSKELTRGTMAYGPADLGKLWFVPSFDGVLAGTRSERMKGRVLLQFQRGLAAPEYRLCPWTSERSIAIS